MADAVVDKEVAPPASANETKPPTEDSKKKDGKSKEKKPDAQAAGDSDDKKLSPAELKRIAKEEKALRRAQTKAKRGVADAAPNAKPGPATPAAAPEGAGGSGGSGKGKAKPQQQDGHKQAAAQASAKGAQGQGKSSTQAAPSAAPAPAPTKDPRAAIPEMFSHLPMARRIPFTQADKDVHPAVLVLGQQMGSFLVKDSISRLEATLLAFKKVIQSYETPKGHTFARHFTPHVLNPQIEYLTACRPMCTAMGNAIRWLKQQIANVDIDLSDDELKKNLSETIDTFARDRIALADIVIIRRASEMIRNGDRVVVFSSHPLVERTIQKAVLEDEKRFDVVVLDDPHEPAGKDLARRLGALSGLEVTYCPDLGSTVWALSGASIFLAGAESMFSNGAMYAAAGTCDIAIAAKTTGTQVVALCESVNVSERLGIDSLSYNEIDPEAYTGDGFRLLFDTTLPAYVSQVITELGITGRSAVSTALGKLEDL